MKQRIDIQALRAIAVSMVVIFHLKSTFLPGGFAGVDVFFVISGFLITSSLVGEVSRTGTVALAKFWARRARRLLPVSLFVIAVTVIIAHFAIEPFSRSDSFWDSISSIFYFENWRLGLVSADYFSAPNPSLFQHYWSLAVEEQFYLVWPVLIIAFSKIANTKALSLTITAVTLASFGYSSLLTFSGDQFAYFSTFGRAWEFGVGALVALWLLKKPGGLPSAFGIIGFGVILMSSFTISSADPFPGFLALLPVVGSALVVASAAEGFATKLLAFKPIQWVGDQSYGIYLWHWPIVLLIPAMLPMLTPAWVAAVSLTLTILLAAVTKRIIEDPIRMQRVSWLRSTPKSLVAALLATLSTFALVLSLGVIANAQISQARSETTAAQSDPCYGAGSLALESCAGVNLPPSLTLDQATHDSADPDNKCMTTPKSSVVIPCVVSAKGKNPTRVLLIGDSHAAMYFAPLQAIAQKRNWEITLVYKASCAFNLAQRNNSERGITCSRWNDNIQHWLHNSPTFKYVFTSYMASNISTDLKTANYAKTFDQGFIDAWQPLIRSGSRIIVLRDGPKFTKTMASCYANSVTAANCSMPESLAFSKDRAFALAVAGAGVSPLDITDLICRETCKSQLGGLFVYRDTHHLSLAYANSLEPFLAQRFDDLVSAGKQSD